MKRREPLPVHVQDSDSPLRTACGEHLDDVTYYVSDGPEPDDSYAWCARCLVEVDQRAHPRTRRARARVIDADFVEVRAERAPLEELCATLVDAALDAAPTMGDA